MDNAPPATTAEPGKLFPAQIVCRTDTITRQRFKEACEAAGVTQQQAMEAFVEATIRHYADRSITHLDGSMCPLSGMINALVIATQAELQHRAPPRH